VFFGHYLGVTAHDDHVFPVWNRMENGENSLIGAIIDLMVIGQEELYTVPEAQLQNFPNPFTESSFISFRLNKPSEVTLQLFDITGNLISTLIDQEMYSKGKHVTKVDANRLELTPGVYIVKLSVNKEQIITRILLV
jgi:hypothetical protein